MPIQSFSKVAPTAFGQVNRDFQLNFFQSCNSKRNVIKRHFFFLLLLLCHRGVSDRDNISAALKINKYLNAIGPRGRRETIHQVGIVLERRSSAPRCATPTPFSETHSVDFEGEKEIKWRENLSLSLLVSTHENSFRSNAPRSPSLSRRIKRIGPSLTPRVAARLANAVKQ